MDDLERDQRQRQADVEQVRMLNRILWIAPAQASVIAVRTAMVFNFSNLTATLGQTLRIIFPASYQLWWGTHCFFRLRWSVTNTSGVALTLNFGYGSIMNIFKTWTANHMSGEQEEYIQNVSSLAFIKSRWMTSFDDSIKLSALLGDVEPSAAGGVTASRYGGGYVSPTNIYVTPANTVTAVQSSMGFAIGETKVFTSMIPLSYLSGIFSVNDAFIPPMMLGGGNLEIVLDSAANVYSSVTVAPVSTPGTGFSFAFEPAIVVDSHLPYDAATKAILNDQSSEAGLQFVYPTYFNNNGYDSSSASLNIDVTYAASVAEKIFFFNKRQDTNTGAERFVVPARLTSLQIRVLTDFKPQQIVIGGFDSVGPPITNLNAELYSYSLQCFKTSPHGLAVPPGNGAGCCVSLPAFNSYAGIYGFDLSRTACGLDLSGPAVNGNSSININATLTNGVASTTMYFLEYIRVASLQGNSVVISK